jgi:hypothetical protein
MTENVDTTPEGTGKKPDSGDRTFDQADVNALAARIRTEARDSTTRQIIEKYGDLDALAAAKKELDDRKAAEMSAAEKLQKELADLKSQREADAQKLKAAELNTLRLKVGQELSLPPVMAERLVGDDEETLKADAQRLLASLRESGRPVLPDINATEGALSGSNKGFKLTAEQEAIVQKSGVDRDKYIEHLKNLSGE